MFNKNTDKAWEHLGKSDPYFGVLTQEKYKSDKITQEGINDFFDSGNDYVASTIENASRHTGAPNHFNRVLDFGCGVGRLTIPLSRIAGSVVGVDISDAMINEARKNCKEQGITNALFVNHYADPAIGKERFDLVHTYIVLQHMPTKRGLATIRDLIELLNPGGTGILHLTYGKRSRKAQFATWVKKWVPFASNFINVVRNRPFLTPSMEMNNYNINQILREIQDNGIQDFHANFTDHGGYLGLTFYFRTPCDSKASQIAA